MPVQDPLFEGMPDDFRQMIAKPIGDWEALPVLPPCHLFGECVDVLTGLSVNKGTRFFAFICQPQEWGPDATAEMKDALQGNPLSSYEFPKRERVGTGLPAGQIWISPNSMVMNREFFTSMGFPETKPQDECIVEMRGRKVLMGIGRDKGQDRDGRPGREYNVMVSLTRDPRQGEEK